MSMEPEASFRARKRQKVYRKRFDEDDDLQQQQRQDSGSNRSSAAAPTRLASAAGASAASRHTDEETTATATAALPPAPAQSAEPHNDDSGLSVAEIMRRRKQKARGLGVEFTSNSMRSGGGGGSSGGTEISTAPPPSAAVASSEDAERLEAAAKRFAPQTGMVADTLDKHMMAYIDSKMAEMRREGERAAAAAAAAAAATNGGPAFSDGQYEFGQGEQSASTVAMSRQRQPAGMGKLMEIDLGPEAARRNIERTEEATRRLQNGGTLDQADEQQGKGRRGRKRRTSEDIKRDKLVEEILRESRLDIYDDPEQKQQQQQGGPDLNDGEAADDRIVEQFRREFMEAVQNRNNRRPPASAANKAGKGGKADERPKGPKLGGSRSARAAMRAMEEKNAKKR